MSNTLTEILKKISCTSKSAELYTQINKLSYENNKINSQLSRLGNDKSNCDESKHDDPFYK